MRTKCIMLLVTSLALCGGVARAEATPRFESAEISYALDTIDGKPHAVKTAADLSATVPVRKGETIMATAPDGTETAIVSAASSEMSLALSEMLDAGGLWTLSNSRQGSVSFTVRHSLCGTLGDGTAASPAKLVDGDELVDYGAGDGYVFTLEGGDTLFAALRLPTGVRLTEATGGVWSLATSANGLRYEWGDIVYPIDGEQPGPDRKTTKKDALPVAYTGDNWRGNFSAMSTLTITSPGGSSVARNLKGTGAVPFVFNAPGDWTVCLAMADGKTLSAILSVTEAAFVIVVK